MPQIDTRGDDPWQEIYYQSDVNTVQTTSRMAVPGGWLYRYEWSSRHDPGGDAYDHGATIAFVPDLGAWNR